MITQEPVYKKEIVEHLVDQLIKLQQEYDNKGYNQGLMSKSEITTAMKTINKYLESLLNAEKMVLKVSE